MECMTLTGEEIDHIAELARLHLSSEDRERMVEQLSAILDHVARIQAADLSSVSETMHMGEEVNRWRRDEVLPSLSVDSALANAPDSDGHYFKVEAIQEEQS